MSPPDYPSAWLRPRSAASVSLGRIIVAPQQTAADFRIRRYSYTMRSNPGLRYLAGRYTQ